jgi:hypothetical protein
VLPSRRSTAFDRHLEVLQFGQIGGDRREDLDLILLDQPQRCDRGDEFGRRGDRMDGVRRHRELLVLVSPAYRLMQQYFPVAGHEDDCAGDAVPFNVGFDPFDDAAKFAGIHAAADFEDGRSALSESGKRL